MKTPYIVELIGLPGAGKTTLTRTLCSHTDEILLARTPYFRNIVDIPFYLFNFFQLLPLFLRISLSKKGGRLSLRDIALMVILSGWSKVLRRPLTSNHPVLLVDEGPICYLTKLRAWGSAAIRSSAARGWWETMYQEWAATLDLIVQLDTSDEILIDRVRSREMWQEIKSMTEGQAEEYLEALRIHQKIILNEVTSLADHPAWICLDTNQSSTDLIYNQVASLLPL